MNFISSSGIVSKTLLCQNINQSFYYHSENSLRADTKNFNNEPCNLKLDVHILGTLTITGENRVLKRGIISGMLGIPIYHVRDRLP